MNDEGQYRIRTTTFIEIFWDLRIERRICINGCGKCIKNNMKSLHIERVGVEKQNEATDQVSVSFHQIGEALE